MAMAKVDEAKRLREMINAELGALVWAVQSLASNYPPGSHEKENASNATKGIKARIDWLTHQVLNLEALVPG